MRLTVWVLGWMVIGHYGIEHDYEFCFTFFIITFLLCGVQDVMEILKEG